MILPFDSLPTHLLSPCEAPLPCQPKIISSNNTLPVKKELDENAGMAILEYIYSRKGVINKESSGRSRRGEVNEQKGPHKPSFYNEVNSGRNDKQGTSKDLDMIDRLTDSMGIPSKAKIKYITKEVLMRNHVTIQILINECKVGISDLKAGGIVDSFQDLIDLKFRMLDVVIDRTLFNVSHLYTLFHVSHKDLCRHRKVQFSTLDLLQCQFYASELQTLQFTLDTLIENGGINATQLQSLEFSLADLISLNFRPEHLHTLHITKKQALDWFKWDTKEYRQFICTPSSSSS